MKSVSEKTYHDLLWTGLIVKALIGLGEIAVGCALIFLNYETIALVLGKFAGSPLGEALIRSFQDFSATPRSVWAFIFLSHGIVKLFLIGELWRNKIWAYPASAVIFILFIFYQLYEITLIPSITLWLITILDAIVVALIIHEYRALPKARGMSN